MSEKIFQEKEILIQEIEANVWETWANFGVGPNCTLYDDENMLMYETPIPISIFNGVLRFQATNHIDDKIDGILDHYNKKGLPFYWLITPSSLPRDLPDRLRKRNLYQATVLTGMTRYLKNLPEIQPLPDGFEIREVHDNVEFDSFIDFVVEHHGIPQEHIRDYRNIARNVRVGAPGSRMRMWQAYRDGQPMSKAGIYLTDKSAGVYGVATKPEARRLGLARILTLVALKDALSRGLTLSVLGATPMAVGLYKSLGYEVQTEFQFFVSKPEDPDSNPQ